MATPTLRLQLDHNQGLIYLTTLLDEVAIGTTFLGATPESLESTADALYQTAEEMRKVNEAESPEEEKMVLTP